MTLLALMYHRARAGLQGNAPEMLDAHFAHLAASYACVRPGDSLDPGRVNVCLTFDDAYFDFYAIVFPLLKKHRLSAVLAVPTNVVSEAAALSATERLRIEPDVNYLRPNYGGFCTWLELSEMVDSGHVTIAAHGTTHGRLDRAGVDLQQEIVASKTLLAERTGQAVDSFVFPYGRFGPAALALVRAHYRHAFRIGGADNANWQGGLLYRVTADEMQGPAALFTPGRRARYRVRRYWNRLRGR
jgi:peptidoglycan/xylan/chitin deacetylase (PgdA/CDA1 family)